MFARRSESATNFSATKFVPRYIGTRGRLSGQRAIAAACVISGSRKLTRTPLNIPVFKWADTTSACEGNDRGSNSDVPESGVNLKVSLTSRGAGWLPLCTPLQVGNPCRLNWVVRA